MKIRIRKRKLRNRTRSKDYGEYNKWMIQVLNRKKSFKSNGNGEFH